MNYKLKAWLKRCVVVWQLNEDKRIVAKVQKKNPIKMAIRVVIITIIYIYSVIIDIRTITVHQHHKQLQIVTGGYGRLTPYYEKNEPCISQN